MFRINRPDLQMVGEGYIFRVLVQNIAAWRKANGIPVGLGFESEVEQVICRQHPEICFTEDPRAPLQPVVLNLQDVVSGTEIMARVILAGHKAFVTQEEAERRASICSTCKFNVQHHKGCGGGICGRLLELVKATVQGPTSKDDQINACYICHCYLKASVWIDRDIQWGPLHENRKIQFQQAPWCWKVPKE